MTYYKESKLEWDYEGKNKYMARFRKSNTYMTIGWQEASSLGDAWDR